MVADEEENKKTTKLAGKRERRKENEEIGRMRLSYTVFASWYLYLNSDGVTYEGGAYRSKRDEKSQEGNRG